MTTTDQTVTERGLTMGRGLIRTRLAIDLAATHLEIEACQLQTKAADWFAKGESEIASHYYDQARTIVCVYLSRLNEAKAFLTRAADEAFKTELYDHVP